MEDLLTVLLVLALALAVPLLGVTFGRFLVGFKRLPKTDPLRHITRGADSPRHDSHPMRGSVPRKRMIVLFVPFDSSRPRFDARLRKSLVVLVTQAPGEPPASSVAKQFDDEIPPLWTWFLPNPCPRRGGH